jgi:2-amino-4-hydroxy-6-hydroxymethyldihydropteridine diphosphokinase
VIREQRMRVELPAVLSLGSNLGDREGTLRAAVHDIAALPGVVVTGVSGLVQTAALKPEGVDEDAPAYLNAVVTVRSALDAVQLLAALNAIENAHGRVRDERWGDRTLDIDIVAYGVTRSDDPSLTLPHPRAAARAFVLAPWLEVEPDAVLPGHGRVDELLAATGETVAPYPAEPLL